MTTLRSHTWSLPEPVCLPRGLAAMRGRVFVLYHPTAPTLERAEREAQAYRGLRAHLDHAAVLIWVGQPWPPPSAEVRAALAAGFEAGPRVDVVAWIVDSDRELGQSVVRGVSSQLFAAATPTRVFRDPYDAAGWLASFEVEADAELILDGLDALDRAW